MKKLVLLALFELFATFPLVAQDARFYNYRGVEYYNKDDLDRAIEDYSRVITLDSNYTTGRLLPCMNKK